MNQKQELENLINQKVNEQKTLIKQYFSKVQYINQNAFVYGDITDLWRLSNLKEINKQISNLAVEINALIALIEKITNEKYVIKTVEITFENSIEKEDDKSIDYLLSIEFLSTTDFNENQFPIIKELFENERIKSMYTCVDVEEILSTSEQELIGIYDESYFRQYFAEDFGSKYFEEMTPGKFDEHIGMYKTLDGQYLVEIQY